MVHEKSGLYVAEELSFSYVGNGRVMTRSQLHISQCVGTSWPLRPNDQRSLEKLAKVTKFPFPLRVRNQKFCMKVRCYDARRD